MLAHPNAVSSPPQSILYLYFSNPIESLEVELEIVSIKRLCSVIGFLRSKIGAGRFRSYFEPYAVS
jgi:hypothetical protein